MLFCTSPLLARTEPAHCRDDGDTSYLLKSESTLLLSCDLGTAPTTWSTVWPFLKNIRVGIPMIRYLPATSGFSSVFSFKTLSLPSYSFDISSTIGATILHGPHHTAQKSTRTSPGAFSTSCSHVVLVTASAISPS